MKLHNPGSPRSYLASANLSLRWLLAICSGLALFTTPVLGADQEELVLRGVVTDENLKPLSGVEVKLVSRNNAVITSASTGANGQFVLEHAPCRSLSLEAVPRKGSSLATAWIDNISGEENRRIVIELQHGFEIHGRIVHQNRGLKGLPIAIKPANEDVATQKFVHGGGHAKTGRDGCFELTLTPGLKVLSVANDRYPDLAPAFSRKLSITTDGVIPDIELPANSKPNHESSK